ncbi:glycosyltransferase [Roseibacillus ishigakijimensis]|uniref:Glycosyltransferase n=1 Tax=Roseibacillus ishigakijimensis TaxID=454146 RepID=A0A934RN68_9BACT|nr:glycosyltransferase [Roseibacillus ishigakijimensis]MBK1832752.1 glycosyltransferase [Roseibacillus ishigakijimensis]
MRIEFVTDTFPPDVNGVAMTLGRLVEGLRARGHLVHVWHTAERQGESGETSLPSIPLPGYKEVRVGLPGRLKLLRRWRKKSPDAVYVATESLLGLSAIKAAAMLRIPVAAGFHTNFDQYLEQYKLRTLKPAAMSYLKKVHNRADSTFAPSREVVERLENEGFKQVHLLGRGVDTELFRPDRRDETLRREWGAEGETPVVLMVGRLAPEKNLELGLRAFREIQKQHPRAKGVIVGDGPVREQLQGQNKDLIFAGVQRGEDLARHYASADILLFPSETETFGNVLLEAMASGLSTVSYDYAASAKHVSHGVNGRKAPLGESERFVAEALAAADSLAAEADSLRKTACESVQEMGWSQVVETFENQLAKMGEGRLNARTISRRKPSTLEYRTIFLSDIHLGTQDSKVKEVIDFLKHSKYEKLVLNGDIIDGWALKRGGTWKKSHSKFVRHIFKVMENDIEVIYLRGNHDDILDRFLPMAFGPMKIVKEHIHESLQGKKYLVVHGDGFDTVSTDHKWIAGLGAIAYDQLMKVNRLYNSYRLWRGKDYFSMSKMVKSKVKSAVSFVDRYQEQLQMLARRRNCDGIICGHIHTPADEQIDDIHYLNSGDWVESLSCVVEHLDGSFEVIYYEDYLQKIHDDAAAKAEEEVARGLLELPETAPEADSPAPMVSAAG